MKALIVQILLKKRYIEVLRRDTVVHGMEGWGIIEESEAGNDLTEEESLPLEDMNEIMNENIY